MTKEEFLSLSEKEQRTIVNDVLAERGHVYMFDHPYVHENNYGLRRITINENPSRSKWALRSVRPVDVVYGE
ncbi:hypothetical protein A4L30_23335 [Salmonella enterica subsp. enterica serovar Bovismorbificans]|nr:hypothetical protein [Salmonella enterica subsp. enterica serovar Bovismorbificans]